jgi:hypothetical protein
MGASHLYFARFLLPALPALVVLAAVVLDDLVRPAPVMAIALTGVAIAFTLPDSLRFDTLLGRVDTRTAARTWVQANLPVGARVAAERPAEGPPLAQLPLDVVYPSGRVLYDIPLEDYRKRGVGYVITSSYTADAPNLDPVRAQQRHAFYAALQRDADELAEFRPYHGAKPEFVYDRLYGPFDSLAEFVRPGPTITIFRLR